MTKFLPTASLTQARLKELLRYNPRTGIFYWNAARCKVHVGMVAGSLTPEGYIRITGEYVVRGIDHRDTNRSNNRWRNLRRAGKSENRMNSRVRSDNKSGVKGVHIRPGRRPCAQISLPGQRAKYLGSFNTIEEAAARYAEEAKKHFGEFARLS